MCACIRAKGKKVNGLRVQMPVCSQYEFFKGRTSVPAGERGGLIVSIDWEKWKNKFHVLPN